MTTNPHRVAILLRNLVPGDQVTGRALVHECALKPFRNKNGEYLDLLLGDKSGQMSAKLWDIHDMEAAKELAPGLVVSISGRVDSYRDQNQIVLHTQPYIVSNDQYNIGDFMPCTKYDRRELMGIIQTHISLVDDESLMALVNGILDQNEEDFYNAPAARGYHHAYIGGLLEHTVGVLKTATALADIYPVDKDLMIAGAILHDIGKIREYRYDYVIDYEDHGRLLGHIPVGAQMVIEQASLIKGFPADRLAQIVHMVLSHHGRQEWGSPVRPAFLEAELLHLADMIDSRAAMFKEATQEDSAWPYVRGLERCVTTIGELGDSNG